MMTNFVRNYISNCKVTTFGIQPEGPETGYGYIESEGHTVKRFVEKPDLATAQGYVDSGNYYWNSGMFLFGAGRYLEELQKHAQNTIDERPAWPKIIQVIDEIPLTTVGKIYKPSLRCEAVKLKVTDLVQNELSLTNSKIDVVARGKRGMQVTVTLAPEGQSRVSDLEKALAAYLFEGRVLLASENIIE